MSAHSEAIHVNDAQTGIIESPLYHDGTQRENADYYLFV
jgi:hypothetical protein